MFPSFNDRLYKYHFHIKPSTSGDFDPVIVQKVGNEYKYSSCCEPRTISFFDDSLQNSLEISVWMDPMIEFFDFYIRIDLMGTLGNIITIYKSLLLSMALLCILSGMKTNQQNWDYNLIFAVILPVIAHKFQMETLLVGKHDFKSILLLPILYLITRESLKLIGWLMIIIRDVIHYKFSSTLTIVANRNLRLFFAVLVLAFAMFLPPSVLLVALLFYGLLLAILRKKSIEYGLLLFTAIFEIPHIISYFETKTYYQLKYPLFKLIVCTIFALYYLPRKNSNSVSFDILAPIILVFGWKYCFVVDEICLAIMTFLMLQRN